MLVAGSTCSAALWESCRTLDIMAKDENLVGDVEEGEISDATSIEEISEDDFKKQEAKNFKESKQGRGGDANGCGVGVGAGDSGVWSLRDLWNQYTGWRGYATSGLSNFAWARAVQKKPLDQVLLKDVEHDESSRRPSMEDGRIIIDDSEGEKEEGELEEGEIDLDSEPVERKLVGEANLGDSADDAETTESDLKEKELKVKSILGVLESTTVMEAQKCLEGVCSRVMDALVSLADLVSGNDKVPKRDTLIQLSFTALETVCFVLCSMDIIAKEQHKETVSRLLLLAKSQFSAIFSHNQIEKVEFMLRFVTSCGMASNVGITDKVKEGTFMDAVNDNKNYDPIAGNADHILTDMNKSTIDSERMLINKSSMSTVASKGETSSLRKRAPLLPLLDLHKDHDVDSLPSPTRETTPPLSIHSQLPVVQGSVQPGSTMVRVTKNKEDTKMHPYVTDAIKAVSSYQQKFGHSSVFSSDKLPSPTPSEESSHGNDDIRDEVSSSPTVPKVHPYVTDAVKAVSNYQQKFGHSAAFSNERPPSPTPLGESRNGSVDKRKEFSRPSTVNNSILINSPILEPSVMHPSIANISTKNAVPPCSISTPAVRPSAKSRDPRLRFANNDEASTDVDRYPLLAANNTQRADLSVGLGLKKQKSVEESLTDGPVLKRQKNAWLEAWAARSLKLSGTGGWLEDTDMVDPQSQKMHGAETDIRKMDNGINSSASFSGMLKDIAVNPTMLVNFLRMGELKMLTESDKQKSTDPKEPMQPSSSNSVFGAVSPVTVSPSNPSGISQTPVKQLQVASQGASLDETAKIRMKPRDPRRILHANTLQMSGSVVEDQSKLNGPTAFGLQGVNDRPVEARVTHNSLVQPPEPDKPHIRNVKNMNDPTAGKDIDALQFTKTLRNIASLVSGPQVANLPAASQNGLMQLEQTDVEIDAKPLSAGDQSRWMVSSPGVDGPAPSCPSNTWGDVEHLFDGYDDKQKAAIQRERLRRLEEQKKMFSARKLCLVLDLDHTLLNSAKFSEVDPVHDEILRKKEEQDREKPQRHLFRFQHMGMWTKLRPGIWNFLDKASKLYELHLYTMGNKLYATEMAKVLDPKGTLFNGRVISRGDDGEPFDGDERVPKSKDLEGVLGMESAVVIIDDSVRVWPHNKMNLIVVERYTYFPCSRRQFGLLGPSLLEIDHDERPEDGTLASSLAVIERIHQKFFSHTSLEDADVRNILAAEQRKILSGCRIVFSRVFPVGEANPHLHPLWQTAEQFGAVCTTQIDENVTHVVANSLGTDKVNWALSKGKFVVHPGWVEASALLYRKANEHDFAIKT